MQRIHRLSPRVANQIAAGEVITEPLSVVKELVENSLDARATRVEVELYGHGLEKIIIKDDGEGIDYEDAELLFERHATSKINDASDLKSISSYGFRGEALASIAAISKITLSSRHNDHLQGFESIVYGSNTLSLKKISRQRGTTFIIEDLFYNTPVREGFLKRPGVLEGSIIDFLRAMALGNPRVSFSLHSDDKLVLQSFGRGREEALKELGGEEYGFLIPFETRGEGYEIQGYLSSLSYSMTTRRKQYFLVNNRLVENQELRDLVKRAYHGLLPQRRFPLVYFFIDVEPKLLDVNIHPRKMEVRFSKRLGLLEDLDGMLRSLLYGRQIHPVIEKKDVKPRIERSEKPDRVDEIPLSFFEKIEAPKKEELVISENLTSSYDSFFEGLHYLGQVFSSFLIFQKSQSIYFCDQHAAHEKILYERFLKEYRNSELSGQLLMLPLSLKLDANQLASLKSREKLLRELSFDFEAFSRETLVLREIPHVFSPEQAKLFFIDVLEGSSAIEDEERLISKACKEAIKAQDSLHRYEVDQLINQLKDLNNPHTCPHGRPIFIEMPRKELERRFER